MERFEEAKLRIKEATDLVALIESSLPLKSRGRNLTALCPFHAENSPSFSVNREGQFFHCFGCGKSGDVFTWLMERDGYTFREAMEVLADRAGISLEGVFESGPRQQRKGPDPYEVLAEVAAWFHRVLLVQEGRAALDYLEGRGLGPAIEPWRLGYHPRAGALLRYAQEHDLPRDVLEDAGLLRNGREMFVGRAMFPIDDERGRTVAFGGRIVPGAPGSEGDGDYKPPKYYNSPESPLFRKRRVLFGLHKCKQAGERRLVVMEGYTDVIACHLAGFRGAVATLGTSFTHEHSRIVERYATAGVVLMFDGDRAGLQAAERAQRELVNCRLPVRIALMSDAQDGGPQAKDPADVVTARPGEDPELVVERRARFADVLDGAEDSLSVWFRLLRRRLDLSQNVNLETAARECAQMLSLVEEPVRREALTQEMARHLAVPPATLERLLQKVQRARPVSPEAADGEARPAVAPPAPLSLTERTEVDLLACVLARPALLVDLDFSADDPLESAGVTTLLSMASDGAAVGRTTTAELLRYLFARAAEQPELQRLLALAAQRSEQLGDPAESLAALREGRRRLTNEPKKRTLRQQLQQALAAGDRARAAELQAQLLGVHRADRPRATPLSAGSPSAGTPSGTPSLGQPPSAGAPASPDGRPPWAQGTPSASSDAT